MHFLQWKSLLLSKNRFLKCLKAWKGTKKKKYLYLWWLKCGRIFTWKWRWNLGPWELLDWRLDGLESSDGNIQNLFYCSHVIFYRALERKKLRSLSKAMVSYQKKQKEHSVYWIKMLKLFKMLSVLLFVSLSLSYKKTMWYCALTIL